MRELIFRLQVVDTIEHYSNPMIKEGANVAAIRLLFGRAERIIFVNGELKENEYVLQDGDYVVLVDGETLELLRGLDLPAHLSPKSLAGRR
ncbi:hypothetical protein ACFL11_00680 [Patescibacteria group bacterium]